MTILEKDDDFDENIHSYELEENENFDIGKKNLEYQENEEISENVILNEESVSISEDQKYDDIEDGYQEELEFLINEKNDLNQKKFEIDKEQFSIVKELSNIGTSIESKEENDKKKILMGLTMKGMPNIQSVIDERDSYHSLNEVLYSKNINKKALEVLFYSNSLKSILGGEYLEYYTFDDIYSIFKNISKNVNFLGQIQKSKKIKQLNTLIKKEYLSKFKYIKEKISKKKEIQESLFSFSLTNQKEKTLLEKFDDFTKKYLKEYYSFDSQKILSLTKGISIQDQQKTSFLKILNVLNKEKHEYLLFLEWLKQFGKGKILKEFEYSDTGFNEAFEKNQKEIEDELQEIFETTKFQLQEKGYLSNKDYNQNIKKYIGVSGFIDDEMYQRILQKFQQDIPSIRISRNGLMSKFISGNESFKKEIFSRISKPEEQLELGLLYGKVDLLNEIQSLKTKSRQELKKMKLDGIIDLLIYLLKEKKLDGIQEGISVGECLKKCGFNNIQNYGSTRKIKTTLNILFKNREKTDEEKENIFIDDLVVLENGEPKKISIKFVNQVKKILIELFTKIVNEYLNEFKKSEEFNKYYGISMIGYIKGDNLKKKSKTVSYITEKGTYGSSLYGVHSSLFSRLEGIGIMNVHINWNGREQLKWIKFLSLNNEFHENDYWKKTLITKDEVNEFKNFKSKLLKYIKMFITTPKSFNNTISLIDKKNNYMFLHILSYTEYGEIDKIWISDGETSVVLSLYDCIEIKSKQNASYEEKDFISTIRVKEKGDGIVQVTWLNDKGEFQKNDILTNLKFDESIKDQFEMSMNKGFLGYYLLYYKEYFDNSDFLKTNRGMIIFDLETIGFTGNILLSYFLYIGKYKGKDCVILKRHSNTEYGNFFDQFCSDSDIGVDLRTYIESKLQGTFILSGHNTLGFDNKRLAVDMYGNDNALVYKTKNKIDNYSVDTLKLIENQGFGKIGLDSLSKANFDFGKNISKSGGGLMGVINEIVKIIKENDESTIKKNSWKINRFVLYNKNDVLMSTGILGQMLKYGKIVTEKGICKVNVQSTISGIK